MTLPALFLTLITTVAVPLLGRASSTRYDSFAVRPRYAEVVRQAPSSAPLAVVTGAA